MSVLGIYVCINNIEHKRNRDNITRKSERGIKEREVFSFGSSPNFIFQKQMSEKKREDLSNKLESLAYK